jgi:GalNAc-alpha-(1->4)-GalNAc-alpha-(1->3)-diNAcBac-PP-undecaprenol alpha-1,4-N-acetyl-D-galactosaminyltransferase
LRVAGLPADRVAGISPQTTGGLLLVAANLGGGGAERQLVQMANHWAGRGVPVTLATFCGPEVPDFFTVHAAVTRVHLCGTPPRSTRAGVWRLVWRLRALARALRPQSIVSFITETNVLALVATVGLRVRVVVSERAHPQYDTTVSRSWKLLRGLLYRRSHLVVAQTQDIAEWVERHCHVRVAVIPNALRALQEPSAAREALVLGVGRLTRQKGFDLLLRAFARLQPKHPDWRLAIFGSGPELSALRALGESLGIASAVTFGGTDPRIETWMARAGLVVQPSRFEGFPNVVLEAMGSGAAVISADCPSGPRDLITDGTDGRLVPVEDVDALARAMDSLMGDAAARERLGLEARKVREKFSQEKIMSMWDAAVLGGAAPVRA